MNENIIITPKLDLLEECRQMDEFLNITPSDDVNEITERGNTLIVYISRSGKMLADAKYHLNEMRKNEIINLIKQIVPEKFSSKVQNMMVDSIAREEQYIVDWTERINRTATHQLDWCRTLISKAKEEMKIAGYTGQ